MLSLVMLCHPKVFGSFLFQNVKQIIIECKTHISRLCFKIKMIKETIFSDKVPPKKSKSGTKYVVFR